MPDSGCEQMAWGAATNILMGMVSLGVCRLEHVAPSSQLPLAVVCAPVPACGHAYLACKSFSHSCSSSQQAHLLVSSDAPRQSWKTSRRRCALVVS